MTGNIRTNRPARAAIAAVLALTATPLLAQTATPPIAPTVAPETTPAATGPAVIVPAPMAAPSTTTTPEFTPSQPVVQATAPVEERIAAATAALEAEQAAARPATARATPARATPARVAPQTAERNAEPVTQRPAVTPVIPAPAETTAPTQSAPAAAPTQEVAPAAPATPSTARSDQAMLWALGGGALLLLGLGGAALMRRRRSDEAVADARVAPVTTFEPVPIAVTPATAPVARRPALGTSRTEDATLEAMVAAAPSADNPFLTRTKRLRRAQHLIAQREAAANAARAPQTIHAEPAPAAALDRSQTVYRFGNDRAPSGFLKPRTR